MAAITSFPEIPSLTQIERIGPKGYLRYVFNFGLPDNYDLEAVATALQKGYSATKQRMGILRCEAVPDPDAGQGGVLKPLEMAAERRHHRGQGSEKDVRPDAGRAPAKRLPRFRF